MFEIFLSLCLADNAAVCRDVLVPMGRFATLDDCSDALDDQGEKPAFCGTRGEALSFEEVGSGVFVHRGLIEEPDTNNRGDVANLGFIIGDRSVLVIDAGSARWLAEGTWRAIRDRTDLPITHLVLTHVHPDHVLGASLFAEAGAAIVGHAALGRALSDRAPNYIESFSTLVGPQNFIGSVPVGASVEVSDRLQIDLGARTVELRAWSVAHTGTDLTVYDRESGILFAGDLLFDEHTPALDGSVLGWSSVLADLERIEASGVVPGHGGPLLPWPAGSEAVTLYLDTLTRDTRRAIAEGVRIGDAARTVAGSEAGKWSLFDAYNPRNVTKAYTELEWE